MGSAGRLGIDVARVTISVSRRLAAGIMSAAGEATPRLKLACYRPLLKLPLKLPVSGLINSEIIKKYSEHQLERRWQCPIAALIGTLALMCADGWLAAPSVIRRKTAA